VNQLVRIFTIVKNTIPTEFTNLAVCNKKSADLIAAGNRSSTSKSWTYADLLETILDNFTGLLEAKQSVGSKINGTQPCINRDAARGFARRQTPRASEFAVHLDQCCAKAERPPLPEAEGSSADVLTKNLTSLSAEVTGLSGERTEHCHFQPCHRWAGETHRANAPLTSWQSMAHREPMGRRQPVCSLVAGVGKCQGPSRCLASERNWHSLTWPRR